jgi:hypothetical protein
MADVQVVVYEDVIDRMLTSSDVRDMLLDVSHPVVLQARARAPKKTGAGARSIHTQMVLTGDEWEALTSWDQQHYYMRWHETGSRQLPARPFLVPALRAAAQ